MLYQHYTVEDFRDQEQLLNAKFTLENLQTILQNHDPMFIITGEQCDDGMYYQVDYADRRMIAFGAVSFNECVLEDGFYDADYVSIKAFIHRGGLPIVANVIAIAEDYPEYFKEDAIIHEEVRNIYRMLKREGKL